MNSPSGSNRHAPKGHFKHTLGWVFIDIVIILAAYGITFSARAATAPIDFARGFGFFLVATAVLLGLLYLGGVYRRIWSRTSGHDVNIMLNAVLMATLILTAIDVLVAERHPLPLSVVWLGNGLALVGFVAVRYRSRLLRGLSWRWKAVWHKQFPQAPTRVLIVGAGESGQTTAWRLKYRSPSECAYQVVGFVDDDLKKQGLYIEGCPVLGV